MIQSHKQDEAQVHTVIVTKVLLYYVTNYGYQSTIDLVYSSLTHSSAVMRFHTREEDTTSPENTSREFYTAVPTLCSYFTTTPTFFVLVTATL